MKLEIKKNLRLSLIIIMVVFTSAFSYLFFKWVNNPVFEEEEINLYSYNHKTNVNYDVFLKPNILYSEKSITEGNIYITEFVDYINTRFKCEFQGEREADIKGDYNIMAVVEGYTGGGESYKSIWKKEFTLLDKTEFHSNDKSFSIQKEVPIKLQEYNDFASKVIEDSKIGSQVKMTVFWNININSETDKGMIEEKISPSMVIPLNNNYFEITGELSQDKTGGIEETQKIKSPVNKKMAITYSVLVGVSLIILAFLIFFTKEAARANPLEKKLKMIFKNHGDRLVALDSEIPYNYENYIGVNSIDDLVRIADEIGKPIMYKYNSNLKKVLKFYVFDDIQIYILDLTKMFEENKNSLNIKNF